MRPRRTVNLRELLFQIHGSWQMKARQCLFAKDTSRSALRSGHVGKGGAQRDGKGGAQDLGLPLSVSLEAASSRKGGGAGSEAQHMDEGMLNRNSGREARISSLHYRRHTGRPPHT